MPQEQKATGAAAFGTLAFVGAAFAAAALRGKTSKGQLSPTDRWAPVELHSRRKRFDINARAARQLDLGTMTLAGSVLFDSAVEHYRGSFANRTMYLPLIVASAAMAAAGLGNRRGPQARSCRTAVYGLAGMTGLAGLGFHAYNIAKRPGGLSWQNLFYAAPAGAPAALSLAGFIGWCAERVRKTPPGLQPRIAGVPVGSVVAGTASLGIAGTVAEAWLLHFRGAFHNPAMLLPVTLPPVASLLLAGTAADRRWAGGRRTRGWLRLTALLGIAGVGFHAYGVQRMMGGWRNWSQNILDGPPLPAPPAYAGLALAGLAALTLKSQQEEPG